jgi:hypothetical protein
MVASGKISEKLQRPTISDTHYCTKAVTFGELDTPADLTGMRELRVTAAAWHKR